MPRVKVYHNVDRIHKSYAIDGTIVIEDPDGHFSETLNLESTASIQGRGNSTWDMPKKPFKIKFPEKHKVLAMPSSKGWVFLANFFPGDLSECNGDPNCPYGWIPNFSEEIFFKFAGPYSCDL